MRGFALIVLLAACAALVQAGAVQASQEGIIELTARVEMEIEVMNEKGEMEIRRVEAAKVIPGDEVIYTIKYANVGDQPAENVVITNPIPQHTEYADASAHGEGADISYSIDGGVTYDLPRNLRVVDPDGSDRTALPSEYTHISWRLEDPLAPGKGGHVGFRAVLN
jgi:uncharacterized repeat protein (TIGR01451 family)